MIVRTVPKIAAAFRSKVFWPVSKLLSCIGLRSFAILLGSDSADFVGKIIFRIQILIFFGLEGRSKSQPPPEVEVVTE